MSKRYSFLFYIIQIYPIFFYKLSPNYFWGFNAVANYIRTLTSCSSKKYVFLILRVQETRKNRIRLWWCKKQNPNWKIGTCEIV